MDFASLAGKILQTNKIHNKKFRNSGDFIENSGDFVLSKRNFRRFNSGDLTKIPSSGRHSRDIQEVFLIFLEFPEILGGLAILLTSCYLEPQF